MLPILFGKILAVIMSLLAGFFVVFNSLFADVLTASARVGAFAYVFIAYLVLGLIWGFLWPSLGTKWVWWISGVGVSIAILLTAAEPGQILLHAATVVFVLGGTWVGAWVGSRRK
jgi:hypothetical protein